MRPMRRIRPTGRTPSVLATIALLLLAVSAMAQRPFYLKNGDIVVFYGDSITDQRLYTVYTEAFVVTRFPRLNVSFVHSGWGGDRVTGGGGGPIDVRLERDVLAYKPSVVTVMLGMNDGGYRPFDQALFDTYRSGYEHIVQKLKAANPGIRMTLIQPSAFDDITRKPAFDPGYNSVLVRYGDFVKTLAAEENLDVADFNTALVNVLTKSYAASPDLASKILPDRVHPGPAGHLIMAGTLLRTWNAPPIVSFLRLNTNRKLPVVARNTRVSNLRFSPDRVSWTQQDGALPMPVDTTDPVVALALKNSDCMPALNEQGLRVVGLQAPRYTLKIDGEEMGSFTREQLADSVNLAALQTPMVKQAAKVLALTVEHNNIHFKRWRQVQVPGEKNSTPDLASQLSELDQQEAAAVRQQRDAAQPLPHQFELVAIR